MKWYWWLFWLLPASADLWALTLRWRARGHRISASVVFFFSLLAPATGALGIIRLQALQARDPGDLTFEGVGLWLAVAGVLSNIVWASPHRNWRTLASWVGLAASVATLAIWILIVAAA